MNSDADDDALSWDGDDALEARRPERPRRAEHARKEQPRTERPGEAAPAGAAPAASAPAASAPAASAPTTEPDADDEPRGIGTVSLVLLGILGGIYLLYTVGWIIGGLGMQSRALFMLPAPLYLAGLWVAVLAPALWFASVLLLTRHSSEWVRLTGLVVGALLLVPWPFVVAGGGGAL
ncbi:DNA polymerase III subunit gamma/tau [Microbacterium sp. YJN-G]|uniref:DNA polymerase III subunit gamma/tau n=1 Tax=Microbacterium sp. YJN-G TaxID=2763257 RepID=UPI0018786156|nr:DNA polymerase III subunit gamma/tau [Microbacterium sp. YJN-G]